MTRLLLFLPLTLLVYLLALAAVKSGGPIWLRRNVPFPFQGNGHLYSRIQELRTVDSVDVLFLGSSHAYRGFDPRIFAEAGYSSFNLGSSNQTHFQTRILLDRYLTQLQPEIVFYDLYPWAFVGEGLESCLDVVANDDRLALTDLWCLRPRHLKSSNAWWYALINKYSGAYAARPEPRTRGKDTYVDGGYVQREPEFYGGKLARDYPETNDGQWAAAAENIALLEAAGARVYLLRSPVTSVQEAAYTDVAAFNARAAALGNYRDFSQVVALNDSLHFFDAHHLNQAGVDLYNREVLKWLSER